MCCLFPKRVFRAEVPQMRHGDKNKNEQYQKFGEYGGYRGYRTSKRSRPSHCPKCWIYYYLMLNLSLLLYAFWTPGVHPRVL